MIIKKPTFENDSYLLKYGRFSVSEELRHKLKEQSEYYKIKAKKFRIQDISKEGFEKFKERPSLRNLDKLPDMRGSIYTYTVESKNDMMFDEILATIQETMIRDVNSRRCIIRVLDPLAFYIGGENDVSCLAMIHYLGDERVNLVFRASDIMNELLYDILTIYEFFILPIFRVVNLEVYSSCAQNIESLNTLDIILEQFNGK